MENQEWTEQQLKIKATELAIQFSKGGLDEDAMLRLAKKIYNMLISEELKG